MVAKKIVVVGDGGVGKTCLLMSFAKSGFPAHYIPTVFETHNKQIIIDNQPIDLELIDTAGQKELGELRPMAYPDSDIVLLCCSVDLPESLYNLQNIWFPEVLEHCGGGNADTKVVMVVNKTDLRTNEAILENLAITDQTPLTTSQCQRVAEAIGASTIVECSACRNTGIKSVFDTAVRISLGKPINTAKSNSNSKRGGKCIIV
ncbi:hypothetical protein DASC09_045820 [Saccharomycopsis crataegensis]|uniref:Uncharacterized protein n=1 Tax=Saccharomycopsis crataegensis TaxID=43959 RepID=A0AAV5QQW0_9ASCO|nr:hypothetical protein DASC09_045820 [Saccharomycopsis crataegensis]